MELAKANVVRVLKDAPAPSTGMAHSVADSVSFLHTMMDGGDTDSEYTESVYGATSESSSEKACKPRGRKRNSDKCSKSHRKNDKKKKTKDSNDLSTTNNCPHCKKFHRKKPHRVDPEKFMWNN
jgi:hypothetical protein